MCLLPLQYIPAFLYRSKSAPLELLLRYTHESYLGDDIHLGAWLSSPVLRRAGSLSIYVERELIPFVVACFPPAHEMKQLHELNMDRYIDQIKEEFDVIKGDPELPRAFRNLVGVTKLSLRYWAIPWRSSLLSSRLTHPVLAPRGFRDRPTYHEVREALQLLHFLEVLELEKVVPYLHLAEGPLPAISLPLSLRQIKTVSMNPDLSGDGRDNSSDLRTDGLTFASLLDTPPRCIRDHRVPGRVVRHESDMVLVNDALRLLLPALSSADLGNHESQTLELTHEGLWLGTSTNPLQPASSRSQVSKPMRSRLEIHSLSPLINRVSRQFHIASYIPFITLHHLCALSLDLSALSVIQGEDLWRYLVHANRIRQVGLAKSYAYRQVDNTKELLQTLAKPHTLSTTETRLVFPVLEVLALPLGSDSVKEEAVIAGLVELVRARQEHGAPLRELIVPRKAERWPVWTTLRATLMITFIDYPGSGSPLESMKREK